LVRVSVSVWNLQYGKQCAGGSADCFSDVGDVSVSVWNCQYGKQCAGGSAD
jgi:hypothetical protein